MKEKFKDSYPLKTQEKVRKQLSWIIVVSICMMFAGLTSAYIVSMGNSFWIKVNLPTPFYVSTGIIIISSITLYIAYRAVKVKKVTMARLFMIFTLLLGIGFGVSQYLGYKGLVNSGAHFVSKIIVDKGRYGDYYEIKKDGEYLTVEDNQYYFKGEKLTGKEKEEFYAFANQFLNTNFSNLKNKNIDFDGFTLLYKSEPLAYANGKFIRPNGKKLQKLAYTRLQQLAKNIVDNRADFFVKGELGKDFQLLYNKNKMDYKERTLMYKGQPLSANLQNKLLRGNSDKSTAYFYIITILHLLHVLAGLIMLVVMVIRSYTIKSTDKMLISLKSGSIFWHFLGILWLYLLLFLVFIH